MDAEATLSALAPYAADLTTMGRRLDDDPEFFLAAAAAGIAAAQIAASGNAP
jgi:hypothetical protein